jgi:hypothetical protein
MSKKPVENVDHSAVLLMTVARAVERMTRVGVAKDMHEDVVNAIAAVETLDADRK